MTLLDLIKPGPPLDADGVITVYEIESGKVVAEYEGLEVHEKLEHIKDLDPIYEKFQIQFEYKSGFSGHQWYACPFCRTYEDAEQNHDDDCIVRLVEKRTNTKCVRTIGRETEWRKVE